MDRQRISRRIIADDRLAGVATSSVDAVRRFVGTVTAAGTGGNYVTVNPSIVGGPETAGAAINFATDTSQSIAVAVLTGNPRIGERVICRTDSGSGRWVTEVCRASDGGSGYQPITLPGCPCTVPSTVSLISASNGYPGDSLTYMDIPAEIKSSSDAGNLILGFWGNRLTINGFFGYYGIRCEINIIYLTVYYVVNDPNFPDIKAFPVDIFKWTLGGFGNTCNPLQLTCGVAPSQIGGVLSFGLGASPLPRDPATGLCVAPGN